MNKYMQNPVDYEKVFKTISITGTREDGLCGLKCKKLNTTHPREYIRYSYILALMFTWIGAIVFWECVVDNEEIGDELKYVIMGAYLLDIFIYMSYYMIAFTMLDKWDLVVKQKYVKTLNIGFSFLKHDIFNFVCIEPLDSIFHSIFELIFIVLMVIGTYIVVEIFLILIVLVHIIEFQSTLRNTSLMVKMVRDGELMISGNPLIFAPDDSAMYIRDLRKLDRDHASMKMYRVFIFGCYVVMIGLMF